MDIINPPMTLSNDEGLTPIVVVVGMHRSGTSLCSHILSALGVDMADHIAAGAGNENGHWERLEIVDFHDRIFALFNRSYGSHLHDFSMPSGWWARPEVRAIRMEIESFLEKRMRPGEVFGFKDPRTARLLPI